ncbi:hypothetical protein ACJX0J_018691, partial [Zea mays]
MEAVSIYSYPIPLRNCRIVQMFILKVGYKTNNLIYRGSTLEIIQQRNHNGNFELCHQGHLDPFISNKLERLCEFEGLEKKRMHAWLRLQQTLFKRRFELVAIKRTEFAGTTIDTVNDG